MEIGILGKSGRLKMSVANSYAAKSNGSDRKSMEMDVLKNSLGSPSGLLNTNQSGIDLIKEYEGEKLKAYLCPAGVWTIGYGHTQGIKKDSIITKENADLLLKNDLKKFEKVVKNYVKVDLTENQFSALVSFVYNLGEGNFAESTLLKKINKKDFDGASNEFLIWNKARVGGKLIELKGLTNRRKAESNLFNKSFDKLK